MAHEMDLRTQVQKGIVTAIDDTGQAQMAEVQLDDMGTRATVEIMQGFGEGGSAPVDGALALIFAVGGDPGHLVALPLTNPSYRFGQTAPGEKVVYDSSGQRLHFRNGGLAEIHVGTMLTITVPALTIQAPGGADAQVTIAGTLTVTKDIIDLNGAHGTLNLLRGDYNEHTHPPDGHAPSPVTP